MTARHVALAVALASASFVTTGTRIAAQNPAAAGPVPIRDNSFLIEEAYNQEWGVVQHVGTFQKVRGSSAWEATFTQEWPAPGERHQLSYTIPVLRPAAGGFGSSVGIGDVALNYRYQVPMREGSRFALAPRISITLASGEEDTGHGEGSPGVEFNLPVSIDLGSRLVTHFNVGAWLGDSYHKDGFLGQSLILLLHPKFNVMVEGLWSGQITCDEALIDDRCDDSTLVIAPGVRGAIDFPSGLQVVPGVAFPIGVGPSEGEKGIYLYLSFEHPFRRR